MAEEEQPAKRVVKRVVRRPVDNHEDESAEPTVRFGRPTSPAPGPAGATSRSTTKIRAAKKPSAKTRPAKEPSAKTKPAKIRKPLRIARPRTNITKQSAERLTSIGGRVAEMTNGARTNIRDKSLDAVDFVLDIRAPRFSQPVASAIAGLVVGFLAIGLNSAFSALFSAVRGTSTGGGRWGTLTVVVIAFIVFAAGEFLLSVLRVRQPRLTSVLGMILALIGILLFLTGLLESLWALLLIPALAAFTYTLAYQLIRVSDADDTAPDHYTDTHQ